MPWNDVVRARCSTRLLLMAAVERRDPSLTLPLRQRDHRGSTKPSGQSPYWAHSSRTRVVIRRQVQDGEDTVPDPTEHFVERSIAAGQLREREGVVQLDQDRSGRQQLTSGSQQSGAGSMVSVACAIAA
jgi:hypothetical protein